MVVRGTPRTSSITSVQKIRITGNARLARPNASNTPIGKPMIMAAAAKIKVSSSPDSCSARTAGQLGPRLPSSSCRQRGKIRAQTQMEASRQDSRPRLRAIAAKVTPEQTASHPCDWVPKGRNAAKPIAAPKRMR